jgi:hypothetical protein
MCAAAWMSCYVKLTGDRRTTARGNTAADEARVGLVSADGVDILHCHFVRLSFRLVAD